PRAAALVLRRELRDDPEGETMHVPDFVEIVPLGQGRGRGDAALRIARDGAQVLDVRGQEQPAVVHPERVPGIGEEAELHPRAQLMPGSRERGGVVGESYAAA